MLTAGMSTLPLPEFVQQTRSAPASPGQHLSYPRFSLCLQEISPTTPDDTFYFSSTSKVPTVKQLEQRFPHVSDSARQESLSRIDSRLAAMGRLRRVNELKVSHNQPIPRSVSIADLKSSSNVCEPPLNYPTIRVAPSFSSLRSLARSNVSSEHNSNLLGSDLVVNTHAKRHATLCPTNFPQFEEKRLRRKVHYKSYQDLHILSMYQEPSPAAEISPTESTSSASTMFESENESSINSSDGGSSRQPSPTPKTPIDTDSFHELKVDENVKEDYHHRLNTRQVHVIEHRHEDRYVQDEEDGEIVPVDILPSTISV